MRISALTIAATLAAISAQANTITPGGDSSFPLLWLAGGMIFGMAIGPALKRRQARLRAELVKNRR
jgi:hypothetical protein